MKNIRIIKTGVDVSKILEQLKQYPEDWGSQKNVEDSEQLDPTEYTVTVDVLQLIMGGVETEGQYVGNTEICIKPRHMKNTPRFLITWESILRNFVVVDSWHFL